MVGCKSASGGRGTNQTWAASRPPNQGQGATRPLEEPPDFVAVGRIAAEDLVRAQPPDLAPLHAGPVRLLGRGEGIGRRRCPGLAQLGHERLEVGEGKTRPRRAVGRPGHLGQHGGQLGRVLAAELDGPVGGDGERLGFLRRQMHVAHDRHEPGAVRREGDARRRRVAGGAAAGQAGEAAVPSSSVPSTSFSTTGVTRPKRVMLWSRTAAACCLALLGRHRVGAAAGQAPRRDRRDRFRGDSERPVLHPAPSRLGRHRSQPRRARPRPRRAVRVGLRRLDAPNRRRRGVLTGSTASPGRSRHHTPPAPALTMN